jgi:hypothetical protein
MFVHHRSCLKNRRAHQRALLWSSNLWSVNVLALRQPPQLNCTGLSSSNVRCTVTRELWVFYSKKKELRVCSKKKELRASGHVRPCTMQDAWSIDWRMGWRNSTRDSLSSWCRCCPPSTSPKEWGWWPLGVERREDGHLYCSFSLPYAGSTDCCCLGEFELGLWSGLEETLAAQSGAKSENILVAGTAEIPSLLRRAGQETCYG